MTTYTLDHLYELLPTVYRLRDAQDLPLRNLLNVIAREIGIVEADIDRLYANWFIETSDEWVVPYISDLLGVRGLHTLEAVGFTRRAFVANTLRYRRRKGTATMLEQLARDTTQWNARVVEFFELLGTTQYLNHLRPHNLRTPDLRQSNQLELLDTPFDTIAHTADVRRIATQRGKHNIPNIGIFLWRLQAYFLAGSVPHAVSKPADGRYTFSSLGNDAPLFNRPQTETTITQLAGEHNVPERLRRRALYDDLEALRQELVDSATAPESLYLGSTPVLEVFVPDSGGALVPIPAAQILVCDLSGWQLPPTSIDYTSHTLMDTSTIPPQPLMVTLPIQVAVDPVLGRLAFPAGVVPAALAVSYTYGFSGDLGGGPYDRRFVPRNDAPEPTPYQNTVAAPAGLGALFRVPAEFTTLSAAITHWQGQGRPDAVIQIDDSRSYTENLALAMGEGDLAIQSANMRRPALLGNITVTGSQKGRLTLNGLLIMGGIVIADDSLGQLDIIHCTLVPGAEIDADAKPLQPLAPSIVVSATNIVLTINMVRSISGPLRLGENIVGLHASDCIIESPERTRPAALTPVLISADLSSFPVGLPAAPTLQLTIGSDGPYQITLSSSPKTLAQARSRLQSAIRSAHPGSARAFAEAQVTVIGNRLVVVPGTVTEVTIAAVEDDDTAQRLGLTHNTAQQRQALISGPLVPFPTLSVAAPSLLVVLGAEQQVISLASAPTTLNEARNALRNAITGVSSGAAFAQALVGTVGDRLIVVPGVSDTTPAFDITPDDETSLVDLLLAGPLYLPAIGGDRSGAQAAPPTTLERVTVLGPVHAKELVLASEVIFVERVRAVRRQSGCVRFSYVPPDSQTPRRFRCQPELAITTALEMSKSHDPVDNEAITRQVLSRLIPTFTSTRYGDPAYAQINSACPREVRGGAEDGSEMGAWNFLKQAQREANLQSNLEEYLCFGLEAGLFFVT